MINKIKLLLIFFFIFGEAYAEDCKKNSNLKIGLIDNHYIDYKYYLYYTLSEYSSKNSIDYDLSYVDSNIDEFDIIFGEYYDLEKLSLRKVTYPNQINIFYKNNNITIKNNIFPLDLDSFILISNKELENINFEDLTKINDPNKYTLGLSLYPPENFFKLFNYILNNKDTKQSYISLESKLNLLKKSYKKMNKNIINSTYEEVYNSYQNSENLYTLFSDGVLLYKDTKYSNFISFPLSKYNWNKENGYFDKDLIVDSPLSFFGFSAYLNNTNQSGFICYLVNEELRLKSFKNFNIELSPLSINELSSIKDNIPENYITLLNKKNEKIFKQNYSKNLKKYDEYIDIILSKKNYKDVFPQVDYLN